LLLSRHKIDFRLSPIAQQSAAATPTIAAAILAVRYELGTRGGYLAV
jgi:hypothetical protein